MPYVEHIPTLGELIVEPFFGKKGLYDLIKYDKSTIDNIMKKVDDDYPGFSIESKTNIGEPIVIAKKDDLSVKIQGKLDITGATNEIMLTFTEKKDNIFLERQYLKAGMPGRFAVYLNKLTYLENGMETSQSKEVYSPAELSPTRPIVLIGDRKIYKKGDLDKVDPAGIVLHLLDTKQVINQVVGLNPEMALHFTYTVGLNQFSNVDDVIPVVLQMSLNNKSTSIEIPTKDITKKDIMVTEYIAKSMEFKQYIEFFKELDKKVEVVEETI